VVRCYFLRLTQPWSWLIHLPTPFGITEERPFKALEMRLFKC